MFERYTEKARRVIFFARYEASQFGSPCIETEHLLLGIMREDHGLVFRFKLEPERIRRQIDEGILIREKISTAVDLPLSDEGKRVLAYAAEEADLLKDRHIGTEHLLLGLLREEKSLAANLLHGEGLGLETTRQSISKTPIEEDGHAGKPAARALPRPSIEFVENGEALPITAIMFVLPRAGEEVALEFDGGERLYKVEGVRFVLGRESEGANSQSLQKVQILVEPPKLIAPAA